MGRKKVTQAGRGVTRREEYAEATREAIVNAARQLFVERGYFATKVDDIAALARVAPVTVYAAAGGKHELLRTLMLLDMAAFVPIVEAMLESIRVTKDSAEIMRLLASAVRRMREAFGDILYVVMVTAPHDQPVADSLAMATTRYRATCLSVAQRLMDMRALREGMDLQQAVDLLWFYFGYWSLFTLKTENGWSYDRAEHWLCEAASQALLRAPSGLSGGG
jgi:AcrR family transcriptional regulator